MTTGAPTTGPGLLRALPPFDVCGPLPEGLTLLEASAGTGKTFTIAALVARYVAAGVPLEHLLVVTFTRLATGELRSRVRQRLLDAELGLRRFLEAGATPRTGVDGDQLLQFLATGTGEEVELRRHRLAAALADFDAATIATTHGFCEHVLSGLGTAGDIERDITFVPDPTDLIGEVVDDLYLRRFFGGGQPPFSRSVALQIGRTAVFNPDALIEPTTAPEDPDAEMRGRLARRVRLEVEARKLRHATLGYDDLLTRLASTLRSEQGPVACQRLQERYWVALIDEFQDTDPIQWQILRDAFTGGSTPRTLVLIGDPKQAIYSFRGADVWAYLDAARHSDQAATLAVNWRSDQGLLDGLDALLGGATLGHADIRYHQVRAADVHRRPGLVGAPHPSPLRVRVVQRADGNVRCIRGGTVSKPSARQLIAEDLAADLVQLFSAGASLVDQQADRTLCPADVAVLVATNGEATLVCDALSRAGVPAVLHGGGSVFSTVVAAQWLQLLEALERPASPPRARAAALTALVGWNTAQLAALSDDGLAELQGMFHHWAAVLSAEGVASLLELITVTRQLPARVLTSEGGERVLTDIHHVGELLHAEAMAGQLGTTALTGWLRQRISEAGHDASAEERTRRLDSDADAVQVITIHRSKGLEFPVVYAPFLWSAASIEKEPVPVYHDPANGDARTVDVGGPGGPGNAKHVGWYVAEKEGEDLRLAYVALTRARHQVVLWWAGSQDSAKSALGRLLFRGPGGAILAKLSKTPTDDAVVGRLEALVPISAGQLGVERVGAPGDRRWVRPSRPAATLRVRRFDRVLDTEWRRSSYTAITAAAHHGAAGDAAVSSEPEAPAQGGLDEPGAPPGADPDATGRQAAVRETAWRAVPSLMADIRGGAEFGTLVHAVLEGVDFTAADLDAELIKRLREATRRQAPIEGVDETALVAALRAVIETPLGAALGGVRLRDVGRPDRLDELGFELPLVGGDHPTGNVSVSDAADLLRMWLPADDLLASYPDRLADPSLDRRLRGYLTGSIDLVLRVRAAPGTGRFVVVDYKTNWLGPPGEALSAWHYRPAMMAAAMQAAHYPLQAMLYSVALHRYLRWRLPGYRPDTHLGGVLYLFLRGMTGADTPEAGGRPCGVYAWAVPPGLIVQLSDRFDRGSPGYRVEGGSRS